MTGRIVGGKEDLWRCMGLCFLWEGTYARRRRLERNPFPFFVKTVRYDAHEVRPPKRSVMDTSTTPTGIPTRYVRYQTRERNGWHHLIGWRTRIDCGSTESTVRSFDSATNQLITRSFRRPLYDIHSHAPWWAWTVPVVNLHNYHDTQS
jgi:hypothetical protein